MNRFFESLFHHKQPALPPKRGVRAAARRLAKPEEKPPAPTMFGVDTWVTGLQLTAALTLFGFIAKLAREQFLGISLENWTGLDLGIFAGRWAIDTLTQVLDNFDSFSIYTLVALMLVFVPPALALVLPAGHAWQRGLIVTSLASSCAGVLWVLVWCEMPTFKMNDWLVKPVSFQITQPITGFLDRRSSDLAVRLFVSKLGVRAGGTEEVSCPADGSLSAADKQKILDGFPHLEERLNSNFPKTDQASYLHWLYGVAVLICLGSWLTLRLPTVPDEAGAVYEFARSSRLALVLFLVPVTTCLLPYMYGKLVDSDTFAQVQVTLADESKDHPAKPFNALLVDQTDKDMSLFRIDNGPYGYVQSVDRDKLKSFRINAPVDPVTQTIESCQWFQ